MRHTPDDKKVCVLTKPAMDLNKMSLSGSATASELEVRGLTEVTKYFFYVKSVNSIGERAPSNLTSRRTL